MSWNLLTIRIAGRIQSHRLNLEAVESCVLIYSPSNLLRSKNRHADPTSMDVVWRELAARIASVILPADGRSNITVLPRVHPSRVMSQSRAEYGKLSDLRFSKKISSGESSAWILFTKFRFFGA